MRDERMKGNALMEALKVVAPGTSFREGLESILRAKTGALIVIGDSSQVMDIIDGGFTINKEFTPAHLYELAKMDGAIILTRDIKKILFANAQLVPDPSIDTFETGIRHRTADRVAKQTGELVISISQRRNIITIYKGHNRYVLKDAGSILVRANQALQTLEKYKSVLDNAMTNLGVLEFEDMVTLYDVVVVLQRTEMVMRVVYEIDKYICELGSEGRLVSMQLEELVNHTEQDGALVIRDYYVPMEGKTAEDIVRQIHCCTQEELLDFSFLCRALGYYGGMSILDAAVGCRGYRMLSKVPRVPASVIANLVNKFIDFQGILNASIEELDEVEGIGNVRARTIKESLEKIQQQLLTDNRNI
ncbi:DNA integrity scanning diadenylate cyclase DisA [Petroclostridium sp. X23]|uniref:DNA integrity scanning diadenylate cyclase DisA n=1 Tax=Petroclostridium sp. X23 TaxID=3045146 RepID=UPI0024AE5D56|nr:DNA integrity scanning diadenylate cyclase DisA [Petroclostridium sp. X23]WHH61323.1 DNA integrity scanning diadenylate cyclase DisA [Petroclostridium sp. X23]